MPHEQDPGDPKGLFFASASKKIDLNSCIIKSPTPPWKAPSGKNKVLYPNHKFLSHPKTHLHWVTTVFRSSINLR